MAADGKEGFLARWARLKRGAVPEAGPVDAAAPGEAPPLPAIDDLSFESDFKDFMHRKVDEAVRRAALKKLFGDPHFAASDGLDVYAGDYSGLQPLAAEVIERLQEAWRGRQDTASAPAAQADDAPGPDGAQAPARADAAEADVPPPALPERGADSGAHNS